MNAFRDLTLEITHRVLILHENISTIMNHTKGGFLEVRLTPATISHAIMEILKSQYGVETSSSP
ncbi:rCG63154 [Rattus norvegicus]|uniref:RCG63154 n=1 Tax=Rattus norvegicus TaxID=10116 RepID=A6K0L6_RAT|nr:rCG63154 [Rattus norvegicus]